MNYQRNLFNNMPIEYSIPKGFKYVFVSDFFSSEVLGGAELTSETLIKALRVPVFKIHASSLTKYIIEKNTDKIWIFGNYTQVSDGILDLFSDNQIEYYVIEFDFKFCKYRSMKAHLMATGNSCDCINKEHGKEIEKFYLGAKKIFWMSEKQKNIFLEKMPSLKNKTHIVQLSAFSDEIFELLKKLRNSPFAHSKKMTAILSGGSWIKGVKETIIELNMKKIKFEQIPQMEYEKFLETLSLYETFTFYPVDFDTCPRVVIEAALLGCKLDLNDNVLIKNDSWLINNNPIELETYLKEKRDSFYHHLISS
jgi:hypothetical protein